MEIARRTMYATVAGKAVVAERRAAAQAAAETARQRAAREAEARAAQEAEAMTAFVLSLPRQKSLLTATHRANASKAMESVA
jgi:hypothetical protein